MKRLRTKFSLSAALFALLGGAHVTAAYSSGLTVGQIAPPLTMTTLDGAHVNTRDFAGKVVFLTFWATWCEPCRAELPALSQYAADHADRGFVALGLSLDAPADMEQVRSVARKLSFLIGLLGDPHVAGYGRIWRLPVSFVIDRQGRLAVNGWNDKEPAWNAARLEHEITPLLGPAAR